MAREPALDGIFFLKKQRYEATISASKTRGDGIAQSLADALPRIMEKIRNESTI